MNPYMEMDEELGHISQFGNASEDMDLITPDGGDMMTQQGMPVERTLQLAERANEVYRDQVKYLQDHLTGMRSLLEDKECIIENLILRYDMGILPSTSSQTGNIPSDSVDDKELRRKAEALAQRTILENFELRELVNELRMENENLRNGIYDLQDRLNRQALLVNKIAKNAAVQQASHSQENVENQRNDGVHAEAVTPEAQLKREERAEKQSRRQPSVTQPTDFFESQENEEEYGNGDSSNQKKEMTTQDIFDEEEEERQAQENEEDDEHWNENAQKKRSERQEKAHEKKSTLTTPENFFDDNNAGNDEENKPPSNPNETEDRPAKRRRSKKLDPSETEEARAKRQERYDKDHTRQESGAIPSNLFESDPANTEEAKRTREERAKKGRKESIAVPKAFLTAGEENDSEDDASKEKRRKHQRKQSLMKTVGDKGHLSDEDTEKSKNADYEARRKMEKANAPKGKEPPVVEQSQKPQGHRESTLAAPNLELENSVMLLTKAEEEIKNLKDTVKKTEEEKKKPWKKQKN